MTSAPKIALLACGSIVALFTAALLAGLIYIGIVGPETRVVAGQQMKSLQNRTIRELGLLETGETIKYFYSDALLDIRDGMYFVTDRRLILYGREWSEPLCSIKFADIAHVDVEYDSSFWIDSTIQVDLKDEDTWVFPVSSEGGMDRTFFEYLQRMIPKEELPLTEEVEDAEEEDEEEAK